MPQRGAQMAVAPRIVIPSEQPDSEHAPLLCMSGR